MDVGSTPKHSIHRPRILIATAQVPFTRGGAELLSEQLCQALCAEGFEADIVQIPFSALPKENLVKQILQWRSLDLRTLNGQEVDMLIALKFPAYLCQHPKKVLWLVHQYRQAYDLYGGPFGDLGVSADDEALRRLIHHADNVALNECGVRYSISSNVARRLERFLKISSEVIVPPLPYHGRYYSAESGDYILAAGRVCSIKRLDLMIRALATVDDRLSLKIVGKADEAEIQSYLQSEIEKHHLSHRVEFLGRVSDERLLDLYARAFLVYYAPYDEDLGFGPLEALASGKPVVTTDDSGGPLDFIAHGVNGLVCEPSPESVAAGCNSLLNNRDLLASLDTTLDSVGDGFLSWGEVVERLTASLRSP